MINVTAVGSVAADGNFDAVAVVNDDAVAVINVAPVPSCQHCCSSSNQ